MPWRNARTAPLGNPLAGLLAMLAAVPVLGAEIRARVVDDHGNGVGDAVVVAAAVGGGPAPRPMHDARVEQDQRNKEFVPHVLPVTVGTQVFFPNNDNIRHHVYSFSPAKTFELPLYTGTPASPVLFDKPGVVVLGCNIHDWMVGYVYVSDSPWFAKTGGDGRAVLGDLPAGKYVVRVWHPRLAGDEQATAATVTVPASGAVDTTTTIALKPDFRPRRAPMPGHGGY